MTRLLFISCLLPLFSMAARAEHMRGAMNGGGMNNGTMNQQQMMMNQNMMGGGMGMGMNSSPQMPDNSKQKEAAAKIIKDGEEIRNKQQQAVQKSLEGMTKSVGEFSNMIAGFNKNSNDDSSKELLKTIGAAGKSTAGADEALNSAMDLIVNGFKEGSAAIIKGAQETAAVLANAKTPEVQRKPSSMDILSASAASTGQNALADAMAASSGKSDSIPKFGNKPIGYGGSGRSSSNPGNDSNQVATTSSGGSAGQATGEQQAHSAQ